MEPESKPALKLSIQQWVSAVNNLPYSERRLVISRSIKPKLSRFIFKYKELDPSNETSVDRIRDVLVKSRLWLSSPTDFNDPFDTSAKLIAISTAGERRKRFNEILKIQGVKYKDREKKIRQLMKNPVDEWERQLRSIYHKNIGNLGVVSFAGDPRNILMWSHYAQHHKGICIQFEVARDFLTLSNALTVKYSKEYPVINWAKSDFAKSIEKVILRKHEGWSYEQEKRIIRMGEAHNHLKFDPSAVVSIIFGCRTSNASREIIESLLKERRQAKMPSIRLYYARKHASEYRLSILRSSD